MNKSTETPKRTEALLDAYKEKQEVETVLDPKAIDKSVLEKFSCGKIPIMLKVSPDIDENSIEKISEIVLQNSINAIILTNTTDSNRRNLKDIQKNETGGLSGKPLEEISNNLIKKFYKTLKGKTPIIGVGGVDSGKSAYNKIISGASLIQLYTGMIFKGPEIVKNIKNDLIKYLKQDGVKNYKEIIGKNIKN